MDVCGPIRDVQAENMPKITLTDRADSNSCVTSVKLTPQLCNHFKAVDKSYYLGSRDGLIFQFYKQFVSETIYFP